MRFKKGQSGNPGGRPRLEKNVREIAQRHGEQAVRRLASLVDDEDKRVAIAACQALLDRGFGKPMQSMQMEAELSGSLGHDLSGAELDERLRAMVAGNKELIESIMNEVSK